MFDLFRSKQHRYIACSKCLYEISGFRYKCLECPSTDICMKCRDVEHWGHILVRIADSSTARLFTSFQGAMQNMPILPTNYMLMLDEVRHLDTGLTPIQVTGTQFDFDGPIEVCVLDHPVAGSRDTICIQRFVRSFEHLKVEICKRYPRLDIRMLIFYEGGCSIPHFCVTFPLRFHLSQPLCNSNNYIALL